MNAQDIRPGQVYKHYKGKLYKVLAVAVDTEAKWIDDPAQISDKEKRVIYRCFGEGHALSTEIVWDRPYEMFAGNIEIDGIVKSRFELVENAQNNITVQSYEKGIAQYIEKTPAQVGGIFKNWIDAIMPLVSKDAKIIEIGSGFGRDARYFEEQGFSVERTDATQAFINVLKKDGYAARNFNIVTDDFTKKYELVYAAAVFLHLNRQEMSAVLRKIYEALNENGILAFSVKVGDGEEWESDKIDHPRYFCYWQPDGLKAEVHKAGFEIVQNFADDKWIALIARKI